MAMRWAQIMSKGRMHLAPEPGEEAMDGHIVRAGYIGAPLCQTPRFNGYRMTANVSFASGCKNCIRIAKKRGWW
jgi:hypothetical protein